jgi:hypothetical protein
VLFESNESGIDGALVEIQSVIRNLQEPVCNTVGMLRAHSGQSAENHEIKCALQDLS